MHLRRAMLLFAIVLGLAALAAALQRPSTNRSPKPSVEPPPALAQREARPTPQLRFDADNPRQRRRLGEGRRASVTVNVVKPGQVELAGLGLTAAAEPLTPARFDVLTPRPGRYEVLYTPAGELASRRVGMLIVSPPAASGG
jgi:hypothetical protein